MSAEVVFSEFLREQRRAAGYSQEDLAERSGLSVGAIGSLEQGLRRAPRRETVRALAAALQLSDAVRRRFEEVAARARGRQPRGESGIPVSLTPFIERNEVNELKALLADHRLVTVTGTGGVGKTRTVIEVARRVEPLFDETWFVDLCPIRDGGLVASHIAARLNVPLEGQDGMSAIVARLRSQCSLLVIDNCEHVVADAGMLVADLLRRCPSLTVLATSREPLAVSGELAYRLPSMDLSSASDLFVARAQAADYGLSTDERYLTIIAEICKELNGIPLAIELAASRASALGLESLRKRLKAGGITLTGSRDLPLRQQTMAATIAWSYDLLGDAERLLFQRLSVFFGSFTLEAAEEICSDEALLAPVIADSLSRLVQKSLMNVEHVGTSTRYRFLDSIRTFAWDRLSEGGQLEKTMRRLIEWFTGKAPSLEAETPAALLTDLYSELDNVAAAIHWAQSARDYPTIVSASQLLFSFARVWTGTRRQMEVRTLGLELLESLKESENPETVGRLIYAIAPFLTEAELFGLSKRATPLLIAASDSARAASLLIRCAVVECERGDAAAAERYLISGEALLSSSEEHRSRGGLYCATRAYIRLMLKDAAGARALLDAMPRDDVDAGFVLAAIEAADQQVEKAIEILKGIKSALERHPFRTNRIINVCGNLADNYLRLGNARAAEAELREGVIVALEVRPPDARMTLDLGQSAAVLAATSGRVELAARLLGACEQRASPASLQDIFTLRDLATKAIQDRLSLERAEALRHNGRSEDLFDLLEEFLAQPAAAESALPSATSSPRAISTRRASPN
jgi:predicted ATPase/DNA-binding XRE family transcriptional regulator